MKVPPKEYAQTVAFYREVLGLEPLRDPAWSATESTRFDFGGKVLWIDRMDGMDRAEVWLEIETDDAEAAERYLAKREIRRRDDAEPLPDGWRAFWVASPAGVIHLVTEGPDGEPPP
ncbi:MAG: hypothetical protein R3323_05835 [Wenzhouxiangellaceae bacterium]|nr:hypothetical protein [Wenzhouxiangellaceae bacterium]